MDLKQQLKLFTKEWENELLILLSKELTVSIYFQISNWLGTIFAYGQTSSGKTFTMHGDESSPGLLYLASKDIFDYIANTTEREFILRGSYVELYKEEVKDLLDPSTPSLRIRENYEREVYVESKEEVIHNYNDLLNVELKNVVKL